MRDPIPLDEPATDFELETWEKEAARKVSCTGCYGVGQRQERASRREPDKWALCPWCEGTGECVSDEAKLRLIAEVRRHRRMGS